MMAAIAGWTLLGLAVAALLWTARLDRRLQGYRTPGTPRAAYLGPIGRWQRAYYVADGHGLLVRTRWSFGLFCLMAILAVLVLESAR